MTNEKMKFFSGCFMLLLALRSFPAVADDRSLLQPGDESGLCAMQPAAVSPVGGAKVSERIFGLPGLSNAGRVSPGIFRGAQPEPGGYETLKKVGIKTVINLRSRHSEKNAVEAAGMKSVEVPISMLDRMKPETVQKVIALMSAPENQPVYLHCKLGQDRTGVIVAIYRMEVDGWPLADAEAEMQSYGFNDIWRYLKNYVRTYGKGRGTEEH